jgi:hypothetical protein
MRVADCHCTWIYFRIGIGFNALTGSEFIHPISATNCFQHPLIGAAHVALAPAVRSRAAANSRRNVVNVYRSKQLI